SEYRRGLSNRAINAFSSWAMVCDTCRKDFLRAVDGISTALEKRHLRFDRVSVLAVVANSTWHPGATGPKTSRPHSGIAGLGSFADERIEAHLKAHEALNTVNFYLPSDASLTVDEADEEQITETHSPSPVAEPRKLQIDAIQRVARLLAPDRHQLRVLNGY